MKYLIVGLAALTMFLVLPVPNAHAGLLVSSTLTAQVLEYDSLTGAPVGTGVFVPSGSAGMNGPYGLVFGPNGNLFVGNPGLGILEFNGTTGAPVGGGVFVAAGSAGLNEPYGMAFGADGNLYVSSRFSGASGLGQVLEYNGTTGAPVGSGIFVQGSNTGLHDPLGLTFGPNGNLFVVDGSTGSVLQYNGTTGAPVGTGAFAQGFNSVGLAFGPNGNLFVTDAGQASSTSRVLEYSGTSGAFLTTFVAAGSGGLNGPSDLVFGPNGNLFVTSSNGVLEYDGLTGNFITAFVTEGSAGLNDPTAVAFSPSDFAPAPEPASFTLLAIGIASLAGYKWRRSARAT